MKVSCIVGIDYRHRVEGVLRYLRTSAVIQRLRQGLHPKNSDIVPISEIAAGEEDAKIFDQVSEAYDKLRETSYIRTGRCSV